MSEIIEVEIPGNSHELLATNHLGLISVFRNSDGAISTTPVGYVWDGERVRISTLKSRLKYRNLVADPRITFCIISWEDPTKYIELRGVASLEDDLDRSFFRRQFREGTRIMNGAEQDPPEDLDTPDAERVIITIHPQKISSPLLYGGRMSK